MRANEYSRRQNLLNRSHQWTIHCTQKDIDYFSQIKQRTITRTQPKREA